MSHGYRVNAPASLAIGTGLGALVLGSGGRLAMRGVTLWEHRPHLFSVNGTVTVFLWGAGFGLAAGALRVGLEMVFDRWTPNLSRAARLTIFVVVCLGVTLVLLTPLTVPRLALFPPVVLMFIAGFEAAWQRWAHAAPRLAQSVAVVDD
jgi:hypothetical protein